MIVQTNVDAAGIKILSRRIFSSQLIPIPLMAIASSYVTSAFATSRKSCHMEILPTMIQGDLGLMVH